MNIDPTCNTFIAIDPGASGGIAWSNRFGTFAVPMPSTRRGIYDAIALCVQGPFFPIICTIERVAMFIPQGGASQMMEYGKQVERVECVMEIGFPGVDTRYIQPKAWQAALGLGGSNRTPVPRPPPAPRPPKNLSEYEKKAWIKEQKAAHKELTKEFSARFASEIKDIKANNDRAKREWKRSLRDEAIRRYPNIAVTLDNCDSLLILDASIKLETQQLQLL